MISVNGIKYKYRHKTNMFETEIDGVRFHLYLADSEENTGQHRTKSTNWELSTNSDQTSCRVK